MFRRFRRVVDAGELAATVAARTGLPLDQVTAVLDLEFEYLVVLGIAHDPAYTFRFYDARDRERARSEHTGIVQTARVARDAERLAGVPADAAQLALDAET